MWSVGWRGERRTYKMPRYMVYWSDYTKFSVSALSLGDNAGRTLDDERNVKCSFLLRFYKASVQPHETDVSLTLCSHTGKWGWAASAFPASTLQTFVFSRVSQAFRKPWHFKPRTSTNTTWACGTGAESLISLRLSTARDPSCAVFLPVSASHRSFAGTENLHFTKVLQGFQETM